MRTSGGGARFRPAAGSREPGDADRVGSEETAGLQRRESRRTVVMSIVVIALVVVIVAAFALWVYGGGDGGAHT